MFEPIWFIFLFLHWTLYKYSRKFDLQCIFTFLTEILEHTMLKFTIYGGDNFTWLGQGMYIMLGRLFLFSGQFLLIYGAFFHFWQRSQGPPCPNILYVV